MGEKKPIASTLREMQLNAEETFPLSQKISVSNTISGRMELEKREGRRWSVRTDRKRDIIIVKRIN